MVVTAPQYTKPIPKMSRFSDFIKTTAPHEPRLPLIHSCEAFYFRSIAEKQELQAVPCPVFPPDSLIYFFYGRPAYRPTKDHKAVRNLMFMPVCIVLKADFVSNPKRIAPFDTGAFKRDLFAEHMHKKMKVEDFLLDNSMDMPARLVGHFYGTNRRYFQGEPVSVQIPPREFEAQCFYNLVCDKGKSLADDRCLTIEIQADRTVTLNAGDVLLVVLPNAFMDDPWLRARICNDWSAEVRTYDTHRCDPAEYLSRVYHEVETYLEDKNYL